MGQGSCRTSKGHELPSFYKFYYQNQAETFSELKQICNKLKDCAGIALKKSIVDVLGQLFFRSDSARQATSIPDFTTVDGQCLTDCGVASTVAEPCAEQNGDCNQCWRKKMGLATTSPTLPFCLIV